MSLERAKAHLKQYGLDGCIIIPEKTSATVAEAAEALGCSPAEIAKTLAFLLEEGPILIVVEGTARIDNKKFKAVFHQKAKMIPADRVNDLVGHEPGGVCPFGVKEGVRVYLDESLKRFEVVYPAAGTGRSAVRLTIPELETCSGYAAWIDVCKEPE